MVAARTQVVFGAGGPDADVLVVGEAPGAEEDRLGVPLAGRSDQLLAELLAEVGLGRDDVYVTNLVRCRPPDNRSPHAPELDACAGWLERTVELVEPKVVLALGNFATRLLRGDPAGIMRRHGQVEELVLGPRRVRLLPMFHPAAALYTPQNLETLRADLAQLPALLALPALAPPEPAAPSAPAIEEVVEDDLRLF